jgi:hypothetical protein
MPIKVTNIVSDGDLLFEEDNVKIRVISSP